MKRSGTKVFLLLLLISPLCFLLLSACNPEEIIIPTPPATVTITGHVLALSTSGIGILPGATVSTIDGSMSTTTDGTGFWTLEDIPNADQLLVVTSPGPILPYPPAYNAFPVASLKIYDYNLQTIDPCLFWLLLLSYIKPGVEPANMCMLFGAVVGFASMDPLVTVPLAGATVQVLPSEYQVSYLDPTGMPDPTLTETSASGAFLVVVPDASAYPIVSLSGSIAGRPLSGSPMPAFPGGFVPVGLIDPYFVP